MALLVFGVYAGILGLLVVAKLWWLVALILLLCGAVCVAVLAQARAEPLNDASDDCSDGFAFSFGDRHE